MSSDVQVFVPIEERHGDGCTCRSAGRIELDLVMASRACPGDRNPHRAGSITAQLKSFEPEPYPGIGIDITWPPPVGNGGGMTTHRMLANDHATGQPLLAITGLRIVLGGDQWDAEVIKADIKTFVNADGQPLMGPGAPVVRDPEDPERFYSKVFRCYVVEMRTAGDQPDEIRLFEDGPVERMDLRFRRDAAGSATVNPTWGTRIAEAAKAIVTQDPIIPTRESVARGEHTIDEYRAHHGITDNPIRLSRDPDDPSHIHQFAAKDPLTVPHQYWPCACGETLGDETADQHARTTEESQP